MNRYIANLAAELDGQANKLPNIKRKVRMVFAMLMATVVSLGALEICTSASMPPPPAPPTISETVKGSTIAVIATGLDFFYESGIHDPYSPMGTSQDPKYKKQSEQRWLRAKVNEVLYCKPLCTQQSEIIIGLHLRQFEIPDADQNFINKPQIYLLRDRPIAVPADFEGKWYAVRSNFSTSFLSLDERAEVERAVQKIKSSFNQ